MRLVVAVVIFLARTARADTPCDTSHVHTAFVHPIKVGRSGSPQLDTLAAALIHDGYTATVRRTALCGRSARQGDVAVGC